MKLIDKEKLIKDIEEVWNWETIDSTRATIVLKMTISDILNEPTVDAIPIEWLRQKQNEHANDGFEWIYDEIINEWEREKQK